MVLTKLTNFQEFILGISIEEPRGDGDSSFLSAMSQESRGGRTLDDDVTECIPDGCENHRFFLLILVVNVVISHGFTS